MELVPRKPRPRVSESLRRLGLLLTALAPIAISVSGCGSGQGSNNPAEPASIGSRVVTWALGVRAFESELETCGTQLTAKRDAYLACMRASRDTYEATADVVTHSAGALATRGANCKATATRLSATVDQVSTLLSQQLTKANEQANSSAGGRGSSGSGAPVGPPDISARLGSLLSRAHQLSLALPSRC
jgi:hypothetical protein